MKSLAPEVHTNGAHMDITTRIMPVTPHMAKEWLKHNPRNRRQNPQLITQYVRDMLAGRWQLNGEAIKISANGEVLDGQHRLEAIAKADITVTMLVVEGLPDTAQDTMDTGRKRSVGDALTIRGEAYSHILAAVIRRAWQWDLGNRRFTAAPTPTPSECHAYLDDHPSLRRSSEIGSRVSNGFKVTKASVVGTAHHLFQRIDQSDTALFMAQLETGADLHAGHPILALRSRFTQDKLEKKSVQFGEEMYAMIRAWNAVRAGEALTVIKVFPNYKEISPK